MGKMIIDDGIIDWFDGPEWDEVVEQVFESMATKVQEYAKTKAPWSDRTGMARAGLSTDVMASGGQVTLELSHTVDYGMWLELIQNGNYAIIMPTLERYAPEVFREAEEAIAKARRGRG